MKFSPIIMLILLSMSCKQEYSSTSIHDEMVDFNANELLSQYNLELRNKWGVTIPSIRRGIHAKGSLEYTMERSKSDGRSFVSFLFVGSMEGSIKNDSIRIDFGTDSSIDFPRYQKNAELLFIGNQLIIEDSRNNKMLNLYVDNGTINKTPQLKTIEGYMLRTSKEQ